MGKNIIVTSGDLRRDYNIIGMITHYFSSIVQKKPETADDIFKFVVEKLQEKAEGLGGDAIISVRFQREYIGSGYVQGSTLFSYGTVVKFNEE
jgi:uncharacterized protein YbjQ (UPF0145 family)